MKNKKHMVAVVLGIGALSAILAVALSILDFRAFFTRGHDVQRIQGEWRVAASMRGGSPRPTSELSAVVFEGDTLIYRFKGGQEKSFAYRLDQQHQWFDVLRPEITPMLGIYELEEASLKICLNAGHGERSKASIRGRGQQTTCFLSLSDKATSTSASGGSGRWRRGRSGESCRK